MPGKSKTTTYPGIIPTVTGIVVTVIFLIIAFSLMAESASGKAAEIHQDIPAVSASHNQGHTVFEQTCQFCHTIGGGKLVGPDLEGVTTRRDREELVSFILDPQSFDAEMPNPGISEAEAEAVLLYIEEQSGLEPTLISEEGEAPQPVLFADFDVNAGRDMFTGKIRLENGGAACYSCHNIDGLAALGGGTVGPDLSAGYPDMTEAGLAGITKAIPVMASIYNERPLTDKELAHLSAFLREAGNQGDSSSSPFLFIVIGVVGCLVIVGILQLIWRGRISGVRQLLVKGGSK
ncbi:MAG: c-type cytochrome [Dehalococcoidales bacterium]